MAAPCRRCETAFFPSQPLTALPVSTWRSYLNKYIRIDWLILNDFHGFQIERQREGAVTLLAAGRSPQLPSPASPQAVPGPPLPRRGAGNGLGCHTRTSVVACVPVGKACSLPQLRVPNLFSFTCSVSVLRSAHLCFTVSWLAQRLVAVVCNIGTWKAVCH